MSLDEKLEMTQHYGEFGDIAGAGILFQEYYDLANQVYETMCMSASPQYFGEAFDEMFPDGWKGLARELLWSMLQDLVFVVWSAGVGAYFGGAASADFPPLLPHSIAFGAAVGAAIAMWLLWAAGLAMMLKSAVELSPHVTMLFTQGVALVRQGNQEGAAKLFGRAFALIFGAIVPIVVLTFFTKGMDEAGKVIGSIREQIAKNSASAAADAEAAAARQYTVDSFLAVLEHIQAIEVKTPDQAKAIGMKFEETGALKAISGGLFKVGRCCNPARVEAIDRAMKKIGAVGAVLWERLGQKAGFFNAIKSVKSGPHAGSYFAARQDFLQYLGDVYDLVPMPRKGPMTDRVSHEQTFTVAPDSYRLRATPNAPDWKGSYLDNTNPTKGGPWLDGTIMVEGTNEGVDGFFFKTPAGFDIIPDVDRLIWHMMDEKGRFGPGGQMEGRKLLPNDDSREVVHFNQLMTKALADLRDARSPTAKKAAALVTRIKSVATQAGRRQPELTWMKPAKPRTKFIPRDDSPHSPFEEPTVPISREVATWTGFRHGNAALYTKSIAKEVVEKRIKELEHIGSKPVPGWPGIDKISHKLEIPNELIWITFEKRMFVTDWHGLAALYEAKRALLGMFPWIDYVISGDGGLDTVPRH